ncbi:DUF6929 family protein [Leptolyngbya sp. O-77]|uniref:DUF6929 family protein n=1 Tax=Leptolyngbya sp. O-77 TaxID=1080068 RepID=UPI00074D4AD7|nr:hypothetical protein [Leptolyngbya sp. O-77]BAU42486.1 hypothetical protein O77CONTIG1_02307 [Leptolyngbya sp. O-77]
MSKPFVPLIRILRDSDLRATVVRSLPLFYREGANPELDRPLHVRAGSSLSWFGDRLALVQDDANFLVLIDPQSFAVEAIPLSPGEGGLRQFDDQRGNKRFKLDLEACTTVPTPDGEIFLAFGSGSTARREQILMVPGSDPDRFTLQPAGALYAHLRDCTAFSGSELNLEGAVFQADYIRLFNRGNGAPQNTLQDTRLPVNATGDLEWDALASYLETPEHCQLPALQNICQYDLGQLDGLALTFTDATVTPRGILFSATAEDSPDATRDGVVSGSAIGILGDRPRWVELRTPDGALFLGKVEGLCPMPDTHRLWVVVDADDPTWPCELCQVELEGDW